MEIHSDLLMERPKLRDFDLVKLKDLPMHLVIGKEKRLDLLKVKLKEILKLMAIVKDLQMEIQKLMAIEKD